MPAASRRCSPRPCGCSLSCRCSIRWKRIAEFIENVILKECEVIVAEGDAGIVSFLARHGEEIRLLYSHPDAIGSGAGSELLDAVKQSGAGALEPWCFQANEGARRFYEERGFRAVRFTDGRDNEEKVPDVRYRWERA